MCRARASWRHRARVPQRSERQIDRRRIRELRVAREQLALEAAIGASDLPTDKALVTFQRISGEHAACLA